LQIAKLIPPEASGRYSRHAQDPPLPESASSNAAEALAPPPPPALRASSRNSASPASAHTPLSDAALRADVAEATTDADNRQPVAPPKPNVWQSDAGVFTCTFQPHASEDSNDNDGRRRSRSVAHRAKRFQGVAAVLLALSFRWALQQMLAMAKGLLLSHRVNVVHGDVSLNNYLWGDGGRLKLMDFDRAADVRSRGYSFCSHHSRRCCFGFPACVALACCCVTAHTHTAPYFFLRDSTAHCEPEAGAWRPSRDAWLVLCRSHVRPLGCLPLAAHDAWSQEHGAPMPIEGR
jgi:hypothetical protein